MNLNTRPPLPNFNLTRVTRRYGRRLEETLGSRTPFLFLLGVLAVGLMTEGLSKLIDAYLGGTSLQPGGWTIGIGILALVGGIIFYNLPQRVWMVLTDNRFLQVLPQTARAHGLIALVSPGEEMTSAEGAIISHLPQVGEGKSGGLKICWLLADTAASPNAQQLREKYATSALQIIVVTLADVQTPTDTFLATQRILQEIRDRSDLSEAETVADFSGGTRVMTAGLVAACATSGVQLQYMQATSDADTTAVPFIPRIVRLEGAVTLNEASQLA